MFVVKIVSDLQQVIDVCGKDCQCDLKIVSDLQQVIDVCGKDCQWLAAGHWCLL